MRRFGVKCLFQIPISADTPAHRVYEERVTIWTGKSFEEAIDKAEAEARAYAGEEGKYLGYCDAFEMYDDPTTEGAEVYSLMRESTEPPNEYISAFYDTGRERNRKWN